ncbi:MAG: hypothetical protein IJS47_02885 [Clostridia bacterium]|nr:hypothetical protein [Clostridia bacterium]
MKKKIIILLLLAIVCVIVGVIIPSTKNDDVNFDEDINFDEDVFDEDVNKVFVVKDYYDGGIPGSQYSIALTTDKKLYVKYVRFSSTADSFGPTTTKYATRLTNKEFKKIRNIYKKIDFSEINGKATSFCGAIEYIARGDEKYKVVDNSYDLDKDGTVTYSEIVIAELRGFFDKSDDLNKDGIITYREHGNVWLNDI